MPQVWIRFDPTTEEVILEDEAGNDTGPVEMERDGAFYLFGPVEVPE